MRVLLAFPLGILLVLPGCSAQSAPASRNTSVENVQPQWPPEFSLEQAHGLTADECKAILVARAALESSYKAEIHATFKVERVGEDWAVTAFYTPATGGIIMTGAFTTVYVARDWSIKRIIGGA